MSVLGRFLERTTIEDSDVPPTPPGYPNYMRDGREMELAEKKSLALLLSSMTEDQQRMWIASQSFVVKSYNDNYYMLTDHKTNGMWPLAAHGEREKVFHTIGMMCVFPTSSDGMLPLYDGIYQLKLMLEAQGGEERVLLAANATPGDIAHCGSTACARASYRWRMIMQTVVKARVESRITGESTALAMISSALEL